MRRPEASGVSIQTPKSIRLTSYYLITIWLIGTKSLKIIKKFLRFEISIIGRRAILSYLHFQAITAFKPVIELSTLYHRGSKVTRNPTGCVMAAITAQAQAEISPLSPNRNNAYLRVLLCPSGFRFRLYPSDVRAPVGGITPVYPVLSWAASALTAEVPIPYFSVFWQSVSLVIVDDSEEAKHMKVYSSEGIVERQAHKALCLR